MWSFYRLWLFFLLFFLNNFLVLFFLSTDRLRRVYWGCLSLHWFGSWFFLLHGGCKVIVFWLFLWSSLLLFSCGWSCNFLFLRIFVSNLIFSSCNWSCNLFIFLWNRAQIKTHFGWHFSFCLLSIRSNNLNLSRIRCRELRV